MVDLLDARGIEVILKLPSNKKVEVFYIGPNVIEHADIVLDEDPYAVARVENQVVDGVYKVIIKDPGMSKSGLKISLKNPESTPLKVDVILQDDIQEAIELEANGTKDVVYDTTKVGLEEREYLDNIHEILYGMLTEVDRVCRLHNIDYYLVFGGLLGVYRHGEIIPWDDDIDIAMTRSDFERFKKEAVKDLSEGYIYLDYSDIGKDKPCFLDFMCRIMYMKEKVPGNVFKKVDGKCREDIVNHQPLDIFILDKTSNNMKTHKCHMFMVRAVYGLAMSKRAYIDKEEYKNRDLITRISVGALSAIGKILPARAIFRLHDKVCTRYEKTDANDYFFSNGYLPFIHTRYSREWFKGGERVPFGPIDVNIPNDYEAYLKRAYYDYYHLRSMEGRIPQHSFKHKGVI